MKKSIASGLVAGLTFGAVAVAWSQSGGKLKDTAPPSADGWKGPRASEINAKACEEHVLAAPAKAERGEQRLIFIYETCASRVNEQYLAKKWKVASLSEKLVVVEKL